MNAAQNFMVACMKIKTEYNLPSEEEEEDEEKIVLKQMLYNSIDLLIC